MTGRVASVAEPIGGKPSEIPATSARNLEDQLLYQRALEAVLWSMPAVSIHGFVRGSRALGGGPNTMIAFPSRLRARAELLGGTGEAPRVVGFTDLCHGPVVLEVPAATEKASIKGRFVDHWQVEVLEIDGRPRTSKTDRTIVFIPPDYDDDTPDGVRLVPSPSFRLAWSIGARPTAHGTQQDAWRLLKRLKMYYLLTPKETEFIDATNQRFATLPRYSDQWFGDLNDIIQVEPIRQRDKVMIAMLASLGIEKGKPYRPDERTLAAMQKGATDAWAIMHHRLLDGLEASGPQPDPRPFPLDRFVAKSTQNTFECDDRLDYDARAERFFGATFDADGSLQHHLVLTDDEEKPFAPEGTYGVVLNPSVRQLPFWSLTIYDRDTMAWIYAVSDRTTVFCTDHASDTALEDGSTMIQFGPRRPECAPNANWIETCGKPVLACLSVMAGDPDARPKEHLISSIRRLE